MLAEGTLYRTRSYVRKTARNNLVEPRTRLFVDIERKAVRG
jgi:hypothetical protein